MMNEAMNSIYLTFVLGVLLFLFGLSIVFRNRRFPFIQFIQFWQRQGLKNKNHAKVKVEPVKNLAEFRAEADRTNEAADSGDHLRNPTREVLYQTKIDELREEASTVNQQAIEQAKESIEVIDALTKENERLKEENVSKTGLEDSLAQAHRALENLRVENETIQKLNDDYLKVIGDLKEYLTKLRQDVQSEMGERNQSFEDLKRSNAELSVQLEEKKFKQLELEKEIADIKGKSENQMGELTDLINRLKEEKTRVEHYTSAQLLAQEGGVQRVAEEYNAKVELAEDQLRELRAENDLLIIHQKTLQELNNDLSLNEAKKVTALYQRIEALELENEKISYERQDALKSFQKIKELNESLLDKERLYQYELTKSRAQNVGLEAICQEFRNQVENLNRQVFDHSADCQVLRKSRIELGDTLRKLEEQHADLVRQDRINRYELQKSRLQLKDLEQVYKSFRNRLEDTPIVSYDEKYRDALAE